MADSNRGNSSIQPEELAPDIMSPEDAYISSSPQEIIADLPPLYEENNSKYVVVILGILFFFIILGVGAWFLFQARSGNETQTVNGGNEENQGGGSNEPVSLTYWGLWEDEQIFQPLIDEYQAENPNVTITYEQRTPEDYLKKLITAAREAEGPDIFRFHNTWLPQLQDIAAPLPVDVISIEEFESTFYAIHQSDLKIDKFYYGIPLMIDGIVMAYNEDMLKNVGISTPPTSWVDDFPDVVREVTVKDQEGEIVTAGVAMGTTNNVEFFPEIFGTLLIQNGGNLNQLDQQPAAEALQAYVAFAENELWTEAMPNSNAAFIQEKVAIVFVPSWQVMNILASNPDLELKVAEMPLGASGENTSIATYWAEGVSKTSQNQVEAWKFLRFLSSKESQTKMYELQAKTRLFGTAYSRVDLQDQVLQNEYLAPVVKQAPDYVSLPLASRTGDDGLNEEVIGYIRDAINGSLQGVDYGAATETASKGVDQALQRYNIQ